MLTTKKLISTIILFGLFLGANAQVLPSAGAEWKYKASLYLNSTDEYFDTTLIVKVQKDTIIEGIEMKMLIRSVYPCANIGSDIFFIYSIDSKVMYWDRSIPFNTPYVLADFQKEVGQSWINKSSDLDYWIVQVDSVSNRKIDNETFKQLHVSYFNIQNNGDVSDSISNSYCSVIMDKVLDLKYVYNFFQKSTDCFETIVLGELISFKDATTTYLGTPLLCDSKLLAVSKNESTLLSLTCFPTIADDFLQIESSVDLSEAEYYLISLNGQRQKVNIDTYNKLNTSTLKAGIYFLQMQIDDSVKTLKFVKE